MIIETIAEIQKTIFVPLLELFFSIKL